MQYQKVLAAIPETGSSTLVFERAIAIAAKDNAALIVFHCIEAKTVAEMEDRVGAMTYVGPGSSEGQRALDHQTSEITRRAQAYLEELCSRAKSQNVSATSVLEVGNPGKRLLEFANHWEADLIVLGRTRHGRLADCLFGTVSDYVIHHARCSLLLVQ